MSQPVAILVTVKNITHFNAFAARKTPRSPENKKFSGSRRKEVDGLINIGVFIISNYNDASGLRIYVSRFVDNLKNKGTPEAFEKSRLVFEGFKDHQGFLTHTQTVHRAS